MQNLILLLIVILSVFGRSAFGQMPPDAGRQMQEIQKAAPAKEQAPQEQPVISPMPETPRTGAPQQKIFIKAFTFSIGIAGITESELQPLVKEYTGREVTFAELQEAAAKVTRYLRDRGYFLAEAYIPQQEIKDNTLKIAVVTGKPEGARGDIATIEGEHSRLKNTAIQGIIGASVRPGEAFTMSDLERGVLLLNDLPETTAQAVLSPGSAPGTTRIGLKVNEGRLITGSAGFDTFGNRYTGLERFTQTLNINDATGLGDQLTLSGIEAGEPVFNTDKGNMWLYRAAWQMPVTYSGLKAGVSYTSMGYRIGKELSALDENGTARIWAFNAAYPIIRSRSDNLYVTGEYDYKILEDNANGASIDDKRVNVITLGVNGNSNGPGHIDTYGLAFSGGHLDLGRNGDNLFADQQTLKTSGDYAKLTYNASRQQAIGGLLSLYGAVSGQYAGKNLDSSEQFILGGPNGVRAYPSGEAPGDDAVLLTAEIRRDLPGIAPQIGDVQLVSFFDWGWAVLHKQTYADWNATDPGLKNSYALSGAGLGANVSGKAYLVRAFWAATVGPNPGRSAAGLDSDGKRSDNRFWMQGVYFF